MAKAKRYQYHISFGTFESAGLRIPSSHTPAPLLDPVNHELGCLCISYVFPQHAAPRCDTITLLVFTIVWGIPLAIYHTVLCPRWDSLLAAAFPHQTVRVCPVPEALWLLAHRKFTGPDSHTKCSRTWPAHDRHAPKVLEGGGPPPRRQTCAPIGIAG